MEELLHSVSHHLISLFTNPFVLIILFIILFGEFIPYTKLLWNKIGLKIKKLGEWFFSYENKLYSKKEEWVEKRNITLTVNNYFIKMFVFIIATIITFLIELLWELGIRKTTKKLEASKFGLWAKNKIETIPNKIVLLLFGLPFIIMEFVGIFSVTAIALGYFWTGIGLYIFKMMFFIPVHFILEKGKHKLLQIKWFETRYNIIVNILNWFKKSQSYVKIHNIIEYIKGIINAIKKMINSRRVLIKKAFSNGEALSEECEKLRIEIKEEIKKNNKAPLYMYRDFYLCVNKHIENDK